MDYFLEAIDMYIGSYSKSNPYDAGKSILLICEEYKDECSALDIYYYYKAYGQFLILDYKEAVASLTEGMKFNNKNEELYILRSKCNKLIGNTVESLDDIYIAYELNPRHWEANFLISWIMYTDEQFEEALKFAKVANEEKPNDQYILSQLAALHHNLQDFEKSLYYIDKAIEADSNISVNYANRSLTLRTIGKIDEAIEYLKKALELNPDSVEYTMDLAGIYIDYDLLTEACILLNKLLIMNPDYNEGFTELAHCYLKLGDYKKALDNITQAIKLSPKNIGYLNKRGNIYELLGEYDKAIEDYLQIAEGEFKAYIYEKIAGIYFLQNDYDNALSYITEAIVLEDNNYTSIALAADIYANMQDFKAAVDFYTRAIEIYGNHAGHYERGKCYFHLNESELAKKDFLHCIEQNPEDDGALFYLGYIEDGYDNHQLAIDYFERYVAICDEDYSVYYELGSLYIKLKNYDKAITSIEKSLNSEDNLDAKYNDLGICYHRQKKHPKAVEYYKKSIDANPDYALSYYNLGIVLEIMGRKEEALECQFKALELDPEELNPKAYIADIYFDFENYEKAYKYSIDYYNYKGKAVYLFQAMLCKFNLKEYEEAQQGLLVLLDTYHEKEDILHYLIKCEELLGNKKKSKYYATELKKYIKEKNNK